MDLRPELGFFGQICAILLGSEPLCLDLGHFAQIWAILLGFGLFGRIWGRIGPKRDEDLRMGRGRGDEWTNGRTDGRMDARTDRFPLCSTGLRPLRGRCPKSGKRKIMQMSGMCNPRPCPSMNKIDVLISWSAFYLAQNLGLLLTGKVDEKWFLFILN